jgi:hypothetical protein
LSQATNETKVVSLNYSRSFGEKYHTASCTPRDIALPPRTTHSVFFFFLWPVGSEYKKKKIRNAWCEGAVQCPSAYMMLCDIFRQTNVSNLVTLLFSHLSLVTNCVCFILTQLFRFIKRSFKGAINQAYHEKKKGMSVCHMYWKYFLLHVIFYYRAELRTYNTIIIHVHCIII